MEQAQGRKKREKNRNAGNICCVSQTKENIFHENPNNGIRNIWLLFGFALENASFPLILSKASIQLNEGLPSQKYFLRRLQVPRTIPVIHLRYLSQGFLLTA